MTKSKFYQFVILVTNTKTEVTGVVCKVTSLGDTLIILSALKKAVKSASLEYSYKKL